MRGLVVLSALIGALLLTGCAPKKEGQQSFSGVNYQRASDKGLTFAYRDSNFDDRGAGRYIYPVPLQGREGLFDISNFEIKERGNSLEFYIEFLRPLDYGDPDEKVLQNGWNHQLIDIYIDKDHVQNSGNTFSLPGRNIEFNRDEGWEKVVVISPESHRYIDSYLNERSENLKLYEVRKDIIASSNVSGHNYSIVATVPKHLIGTPQPHWGFQVCVMGYDRTNSGRDGMFNMRVQTFASEKRFGGGSDYQGSPNVIDILSPDKQSQYLVLSQYRSKPHQKDNLFSIIPMIYQKGKQKVLNIRKKSMTSPVSRGPELIDSRYTAPIKEMR